MNRLQIRQLAEVLSDTDGHGDIPTIAQRDSLVSEEARRLYAEAVNLASFPARRVTTEVPVTGAASYTIAVSYFLRLAQVRWAPSGVPTILARASAADHHKTTNYGHSYEAPTWELELDPLTGYTLRLFPPPTSGTLYVDTISGHPGLALDTTELYLPDPCARLVAVRAAMRFIEKQDKDPRMTSFLRQEEAMLVPEAVVALGSLGGAAPSPDYHEHLTGGYA